MTERTHPDSGRTTGGIVEQLQARIADLEAQPEAIGAGGVSGPLMGQPQAPLGGRWYMVTHDGAATLCIDEEDAQAEAVQADRNWPRMGPHRAVRLVEASEAGFTAADMATAEARGFRDGVASLSANAGEPMFWVRLCGDGLYEGPIHNARIEEVRKQSGVWSPLYLAAPPTAQAEGWISVDERLPEHEQAVAFVVRTDGFQQHLNGRVLGGRFVRGQGFSVPGLSVDATHWMQLPPPPTSEAKGPI